MAGCCRSGFAVVRPLHLLGKLLDVVIQVFLKHRSVLLDEILQDTSSLVQLA